MSGRIYKSLERSLAITAATALAATPAATAAQQQPVGINAVVQNSAQIKRGTSRARAAVVKERVLLNDQVLTGANSRMQIVLLDRSTFTVGANASVAIDRFVYDPARNARASGISVARGAFRFMSGRAAQRPTGPVAIRTPVASIGIRGTIFESVVGGEAVQIAAAQEAVGPGVKADPATATLLLLRGPGPRTQGDTVPGAVDVQVQDRTITLEGANMALYVPGPGLPPIGPFRMSQPGLQAFQSLLRTTPTFGAAPAQLAGRQAAAGASGGSSAGLSGLALLGLGPLAAALLAVLAFSSGADSDDDEPKSP